MAETGLLPLAAVGSPAGLSDQVRRTLILSEPQSPAARCSCIKTLQEVLTPARSSGPASWRSWVGRRGVGYGGRAARVNDLFLPFGWHFTECCLHMLLFTCLKRTVKSVQFKVYLCVVM